LITVALAGDLAAKMVKLKREATAANDARMARLVNLIVFDDVDESIMKEA